MTATARFKQLLFLLAGLALVVVGLAGLTPAAQADDTSGGEECVETQDSFTDWVNDGPQIQTAENSPPGPDTDTVRYLSAGTVQVGNGDAVDGTDGHFENLSWFIWTGGPRDVAPGIDEVPGWNSVPALPNGLPHDPVPGTVYNVAHGESGLGSWFKYDGDFIEGTPGQDETFHTEYLWQKQVRTFVEGQECDDDDDDDEMCPPGTDHANGAFPVAGDPQSCDDDEPIIKPGDGNNPGNNPGNTPGKNPSTNPGNSPSTNPGSNPQGSNQPNNPVTPALAPGAQVPSAVDAGLVPTQRELTGSGGGLGLLGIGTALVGAALLGASFRPRRRVEAKLGTKA
jgi:hypothetical protein